MFREDQKTFKYKGLSFEITVAHYASGTLAFENIGNLSDEGLREALRCSLLSCASIIPRQFSVSPELWTQQSTVLKFFSAEITL